MTDFDIIGPNAGGRPLYGQPQNGVGQPGLQTVNGVAYNTTGSAPQNGVGQPVAQQQGAPVSGLMAGILGLPQYGGPLPGASYLTPGQVQPNGGQQQQPQQANGLLAGMAGLSPQGAQQQNTNIGSGIGGLLGQMVYGAQSRDV